MDRGRERVRFNRAQEAAWPFSRQGAAGDLGSAARAAHHWHAMPVTRSVGCLGGDERRDRIAGREGLVQRLVLVVAFVLLAVLAVLGGLDRKSTRLNSSH